jgi:hypothetical protein
MIEGKGERKRSTFRHAPTGNAPVSLSNGHNTKEGMTLYETVKGENGVFRHTVLLQ